MPLGKLSKQQIARGFEVLEELEAALQEQHPQAARLEELSSRFYTIIPHNFGRARPPPINSPQLLRAKKDMLMVRCQGSLRLEPLPKESPRLCVWEVLAGDRACPGPPHPGTVPSTSGKEVPGLCLPGAG